MRGFVCYHENLAVVSAFKGGTRHNVTEKVLNNNKPHIDIIECFSYIFFQLAFHFPSFFQPALVRARFQWKGTRKPPGSSFFVGTSPDFEMALYTACFYEGPQCTCRINGKRLGLKTIKLYNKRNILTAYPTF